MKVFKSEVRLSDGRGIVRDSNLFKVEQFNVIGENENFLCIDTDTFTTLSKPTTAEKSELYPVLGKASVSVYCHDSIWGTGVTYRLYLVNRPPASTIRRAIKNAIVSKLGFFMKEVDLSFVTDDAGK